MRAGALWRRSGSNSEWAPLQSVVLSLPCQSWPAPADWNDALYLGPVGFPRLRHQLQAYAQTLESLGVEVVHYEWPAIGSPAYNGIFVRDQFFMTPEGAIVARMGSQPRAAEARWITAALGAEGAPIVRTIRGDACFEGADAIWLRPDLVAIGVGNRTNERGASQVADVLREQGIASVAFNLPSEVQHLLGLLQVVASDLAVVRTGLAPRRLLDTLAEVGIAVVEVPESESVTARQAINFVTMGPRRVVVVDGSSDVQDTLTRAGIEVVAAVHCPELLKCAGGLACATGILHRRMTSGLPDESEASR
ncbi:dimethylarginine dimethylaminohydrolase family protein [Micromonospora sp. LOL_021]|uniref:dimethylarginine dimethylaminohydrolase family protein n=1 Tax=Micromonospora sp. LOL_021 TaxID=3345417 RepID=UPI003A855FE0